MKDGLSNSFIGLVNQFDADLLQVLAWDLEDQIAAGSWKGKDLEKAKKCLIYINSKLNVETNAARTLIKKKICLN